MKLSPSPNFPKQDENSSSCHSRCSSVPICADMPKSSSPVTFPVLHKAPLQRNTSMLNCPSSFIADSGGLKSLQTPSSASNYSTILSSQEPTASPVLCRSISCFDLIGTVGCGSYSKVLLGNLTSSNEATGGSSLHAIKVLRKHDMHRNSVEEVKRELRALRWIAETKYHDTTHSQPIEGVSFLQKMSESFQDDRFVFIVLEYHPVSLANPNIRSRLILQCCSSSVSISNSPLTLKSSSNFDSNYYNAPFNSLFLVAAELVLGLLFLHEIGIVHQDIKPDNVMISSAGHVIIADFGASSALPFSFDYGDFPIFPHSRAKKTFHPIVLSPHDLITFTPLYAAPELACRNRAGLIIYDSRADWWSFGVLMYELATGSVPFVIPSASRGGGPVPKMSRRSLGDFSFILTFGALEKLLVKVKECGHEDEHTSILQLQAFVRALLVDPAFDRLTGEDVKNHSFLNPISHLWEEIATLKYPPLPGPHEVSLDPDTSLNVSLSPLINSDSTRRYSEGEGKGSSLATCRGLSRLEGGIRITWPLLPDMASSLRRTISVSVDSLRERTSDSSSVPSTTYVHLDVVEAEEDDENHSPLQPFPSTASLHRAFLTHEVPVEMPDNILTVESNIDHSGRKLSFHTIADGDDESEDDDTNNIEIWNPWIPRLDEHVYPSESYATLPNPYSPQPPLHHCLERDVESQSLTNLKGHSPTEQPKPSAILRVLKDELRSEVSDEVATNGNGSNVLAQEGEIFDIPESMSSDLGQSLHTAPVVANNFKTLGSSSAVDKEADDKDLLFFSPRPTQISSENNKRHCSAQYSLSPASCSVDPLNCNHSPPTPLMGMKRCEQSHSVIGDNHGSRKKQTKKRFSFSSSLASSGSKAENTKRRFSAPFHFPTRGPPSSFTADTTTENKPGSLSGLSRSRSRSEFAVRHISSSTRVQSPIASNTARDGINRLPFAPHELDRMRIEYQMRRATDPLPLPYPPPSRDHTHTATLGRSTGTKMLAQANAMSVRRTHYPRTSIVPNWNSVLENELTVAVLTAMDSRDYGSRDFIVATETMSKDTTKMRVDSRTHSLQVSTKADTMQGQKSAVEAVPVISTTRSRRSSWAGVMITKGSGSISRREGKEIEIPARLEAVRAGKDDRAVRESNGVYTQDEGVLASASEDPFDRLSAPQRRQPRSLNSQHTESGSPKSHKRKPLPTQNEESRINLEFRVKNAAKRRSLGFHLWRKFKRLTSF